MTPCRCGHIAGPHPHDGVEYVRAPGGAVRHSVWATRPIPAVLAVDCARREPGGGWVRHRDIAAVDTTSCRRCESERARRVAVAARDLTGLRFGRLTAIAPAALGRAGRWRCLCDCGNEATPDGSSLRRGRTLSCGCLLSARTLHGHAGRETPEYCTWRAVIDRCAAETNDRYGGRGITVCERWRKSFADFLADMGPRPPGKTIDRVDNMKGYQPDNCRWATAEEQNQNRRSTRLTPDAVVAIRQARQDGKSLASVARLIGVSRSAVSDVVHGRTWVNV